MTVYAPDTSANAVVLYRSVDVFYSYVNTGFRVFNVVKCRLKVLKPDGKDVADAQFTYRSPESGSSMREYISGPKAVAYNLENGKTVKTKMEKSMVNEERIDKNRKLIGGSYITVSARFCNLLDDFNEETYSEPLTLAEQKDLLDACVAEVERLHSRHPEQLVVVCSDSETFTQRAQSLDYVRVLPGIVSHIGNDSPHNYEYYEKTFLDFFTIARASRVCLLLGPGMMRSGFPYAAARSQGKPFDILAFRV